jgi:hypothetical protein
MSFSPIVVLEKAGKFSKSVCKTSIMKNSKKRKSFPRPKLRAVVDDPALAIGGELAKRRF